MAIIGMWHYRDRQAVSVLASCTFVFVQGGGGAHGVHDYYLGFDFVTRSGNKKRLAAPCPMAQLV